MIPQLAPVVVVALLAWGLSCPSLLAGEHLVTDAASFAETVGQLQPGDTLVMKSGEWRDAALMFKAMGTPEKVITLRAEEAGKVVLTGSSSLRIAGEHLVVDGLWFKDASPPAGDIITLREDAKKLASHCKVVNCAITQSLESKDSKERKWLSLYGSGHTVERCHFEGKTSKGTLLVVWLPEKPGEPVRHRIAQNYFGSRPRLGKNGGEIIRVGDSDTSMQSAQCVVEGNYFEHCDGETECISNKSCGNLYRGNFFLECQGTLTLRHGNSCVVEGNTFVGNQRKATGGIRIIGEDHQVTGNHLQGLAGEGARAAICLMNGIENSPANGYLQVKRAVVKDNVITDCQQSIVIGYADKDVTAVLPPVDCSFSGNQMLSEGRQLIFMLDPTATVLWKDNVLWGREAGIPLADGLRWQQPKVFEMKPMERKAAGPDWMTVK